MIRWSKILWALIFILAGIGLFSLKHNVTDMEGRLANLQNKTRVHLETIHVLKAEWAYLNQPRRLDELGQQKLFLVPVKVEQATALNKIPFRTKTSQIPVNGHLTPPAADRAPPPRITFTRVP